LIEFGEPATDEGSAFEYLGQLVVVTGWGKRSMQTSIVEQKNAVADSEAKSLASKGRQMSCAGRKPGANQRLSADPSREVGGYGLWQHLPGWPVKDEWRQQKGKGPNHRLVAFAFVCLGTNR
jgi:hypothetical protein